MAVIVANRLLAITLLLAVDPASPPFEVISAIPAPTLTQHFQRTEGWTGGDVAQSIRLTADRTLWLFGDSFIGKIESGRRIGAQMINNAAAWQSLQDEKMDLQFFWDRSGKEPAALLHPGEPDTWYWPGDGLVMDDRLFLFCKVVRRTTGAPGFEFDLFANDLLRIDNLGDEPPEWNIERRRLPEGNDVLRLGAACARDDEYVYVFGLFPAAAVKPLHVPLGVARLRTDRFAAFDWTGWQYFCRGPDGEHWADQPANLVPLFTDAASEMTVSRVRGIDGWVAVYTPIGIGREIAVRHAEQPWGPWSQRLIVCSAPDLGDKVFCYAAKAHPELSTHDGQLFITYCRNIGSLADHARRPDIYFPQGIEVQLRSP